MTDERQLISMEQGMELFNRCANSLNVAIVSRIKGYFSKAIIRKALDLVQSRHPRLNSHLIYSLDNLRFKTEGTEKIPLQIIINNQKEYWQKIVVDELNKKIDSHNFLSKVIVVKYEKNTNVNYLITIFHHAIIDAISGTYLHSEILKYCNEIVSNNKIQKVSNLPAVPSLEELIAKVTTENQESPKSTQQVDFLPIEQYAPHKQRSFGLIHKQLDVNKTNKIIEYCKQEKATVHGAICAAMMLALAKKIKSKDKNLYFSCRSSVDMRRRLNPPLSQEHIAMIVSALTSFHSITCETSFWDLAREVTQQIKIRLKTSDIYDVILSYRKGVEHLLQHPEVVPYSVFVTNIGQVKIQSNYDQFQLEEISYMLSTSVMGSVFGVAVSTFQEQMTFNFVFAKPLISDETINFLVNHTLSHLCFL